MNKTLSITNKIVLMHLKKQANQSAYVTDLVLRDISNQGKPITREEVIKLIQEYTPAGKKINTINEDCVLNSVKNLINL